MRKKKNNVTHLNSTYLPRFCLFLGKSPRKRDREGELDEEGGTGKGVHQGDDGVMGSGKEPDCSEPPSRPGSAQYSKPKLSYNTGLAQVQPQPHRLQIGLILMPADRTGVADMTIRRGGRKFDSSGL
jgi:hypothetical protein